MKKEPLIISGTIKHDMGSSLYFERLSGEDEFLTDIFIDADLIGKEVEIIVREIKWH